MGRKNEGVKIACENRKARHDYFIHEVVEAGLVLTGTEVKSLRAGKANLKDSYAQIQNGELYLQNMHISPYEQGNIFNHAGQIRLWYGSMCDWFSCSWRIGEICQ